MYAKVIVDIASSAIDKIFDYRLEEDYPLGSRVLVPFGPRKINGFICAKSEDTELDKTKVKSVICMLDPMPVITEEQFKISEFLKNRFHIGLADSIRLFLPPELRADKVKDVFVSFVNLIDIEKAKEFKLTLRKNATAMQKAIDFFILNNREHKESEVNKTFGRSVIKKLLSENILVERIEHVSRTPYKNLLNEEKKNITLTPLQQNALDIIHKNEKRTFLLHGITGSGKTEVYMRVIEENLLKNKTAIMLVPEISLTPQVLSNFRNRFGETVALLHSGLSAGERFDEWKKILLGKASVVVGARSAIFAPLKNIGVIIIDEEHEQSYNSESHPRYITSEIAEFRRIENDCTLILGSATPSMVSYHKAISGEYRLIEMKERVNGQKMPPINIVDMSMEIRLGNNSIFSNALKTSLEKCIKEGNQAILFINRRGFASFVMCRDCGWVASCPDCDVSLSLHKHDNVLKCHYCGSKYKVFNVCPECGSENLKNGSIGTERVVEELNLLFPDVKVLRLDNDTTQNKDAYVKIINKFKNKEAQILVGTQMVSKGHDFPSVTLVGILEADLSLYQTSYTSTEKTFALVTQVAGRAGRADKKGEIILQSYSPRHYVYKMAENYDYLAFYKKEINIREVTKFPPFSVIVRVLFSSLDENLAKEQIKVYYNNIQEIKNKNPNAFIYLNKMRSPITKIMKKYRYQILMRLEPHLSREIIDKIFDIDKKYANRQVATFIEVNAQDLR